MRFNDKIVEPDLPIQKMFTCLYDRRQANVSLKIFNHRRCQWNKLVERHQWSTTVYIPEARSSTILPGWRSANFSSVLRTTTALCSPDAANCRASTAWPSMRSKEGLCWWATTRDWSRWWRTRSGVSTRASEESLVACMCLTDHLRSTASGWNRSSSLNIWSRGPNGARLLWKDPDELGWNGLCLHWRLVII